MGFNKNIYIYNNNNNKSFLRDFLFFVHYTYYELLPKPRFFKSVRIRFNQRSFYFLIIK